MRAEGSGERGLQASLTLNLAAAVRREAGTSEAEPVVERAAEMAQDALHYDTAYEGSAMMVEWFVQDRDLENAGEWCAYALLFGSLLDGRMDHWATWIVNALADVPDPERRRCFFDAMRVRCGSIEEENGLEET